MTSSSDSGQHKSSLRGCRSSMTQGSWAITTEDEVMVSGSMFIGVWSTIVTAVVLWTEDFVPTDLGAQILRRSPKAYRNSLGGLPLAR